MGGVGKDRDALFVASATDDLGDEGRLPPRLDGVGDKLRPAWVEAVLVTGEAVRPYLKVRMPQFGAANVSALPDLFAAADRAATPLPPAPDAPDAQKDAGRKLVGTDGLSCVACHRFNRQPAQALQVMDLARTTERVNEDWFRRFLRDPNRFNPGTRMPAFWPDNHSPLPGVLGGDPERQFAAIWAYLSDGPRAKFPEGISRQNVELVVGGDAVVYRGKLWEAGFRAVAVGYPERVNAAFDAEEVRLSLLWRGRFLNVAPHWSVQGMGRVRPLGTDVIVFPHGPTLAVLKDDKAEWPAGEPQDAPKERGAPDARPASKARDAGDARAGMKFRGYALDSANRPTLLYSYRDVAVEDAMTGAEIEGRPAVRRTMTFAGEPVDGLYLRVAAGKLAPAGENAWRYNDALTIRVSGPAVARGTGDAAELLVPVKFKDKAAKVEVDYVW